MLMQYKLTESTYQKFFSILKTADDIFFSALDVAKTNIWL